MKETLYRIWFFILLVGVLLLASAEIVRGQEQKNPPPPTYSEEVEVKGKMPKPPPAIKIDLLPKIAMADPHRRVTFRVRTTIEPNDLNRHYSIAADCGYNAYGSQRGIESITDTRYIEMTIVQDCVFVACVYRLENKKAKSYCVTQVVPTVGQPP
jgi:hypothetical protein